METSASNILITLCSTPDHTSVRCCLKSFTFCAFVWETCCPRFCSQLD